MNGEERQELVVAFVVVLGAFSVLVSLMALMGLMR